jgi:hypothetical protein
MMDYGKDSGSAISLTNYCILNLDTEVHEFI